MSKFWTTALPFKQSKVDLVLLSSERKVESTCKSFGGCWKYISQSWINIIKHFSVAKQKIITFTALLNSNLNQTSSCNYKFSYKKNNNHPFEFFSLELFHGLLFSTVLARYTPKLYRIEVKFPFRKNWSVKSECQNVGKNLETRHILSQRIEFVSAHHHTTKQASTDIRTWGHHIFDEVYNFLSSYLLGNWNITASWECWNHPNHGWPMFSKQNCKRNPNIIIPAFVTSIVQEINVLLTRETLKKFCLWAKELFSDRLILKNSFKIMKCRFNYLKISTFVKST